MLHAREGELRVSRGYWVPGCIAILRSTCYGAGYGLDWFDAMQCCYYQNAYLAEPQNQAEQDKINTYLTICE